MVERWRLIPDSLVLQAMQRQKEGTSFVTQPRIVVLGSYRSLARARRIHPCARRPAGAADRGPRPCAPADCCQCPLAPRHRDLVGPTLRRRGGCGGPHGACIGHIGTAPFIPAEDAARASRGGAWRLATARSESAARFLRQAGLLGLRRGDDAGRARLTIADLGQCCLRLGTRSLGTADDEESAQSFQPKIIVFLVGEY